MGIYEEAVLEFLTHEGKMFACPQFRLDDGWANPDFLALNFEADPPRAEVVEVSAANELGDLVKRVGRYQGNEAQERLRRHLSTLKGFNLGDNSPLVIRVFIKRERLQWFRDHLVDHANVEINTLDHVFETLLDFRKRTLRPEGEAGMGVGGRRG